ncbi:MAG: hypothetical protein OXD01_02825 [Gammaproteobacteria bacterium]|nr:hypothetical protein [Gammaproteobacteria bacterium]
MFLLWQSSINLNTFGNTVREDYKQFGLCIAKNTQAGATVALAEIYKFGWYSELKIIDILSLVTSSNADFVAKGDYVSWLTVCTLGYILTQDPPQFFEQVVMDIKKFHPEALAEVPGFDYPDHKLYRY